MTTLLEAETQTTEDLVLRARQGDSRSYEELVERHQRQVWAAVRGSGSATRMLTTPCR